jgi:outer membrane immunogenic protein
MRSVLAGIFCVLVASSALAADLDVIPAPDVDPARFGWTGAYGGVSGGYGWLRDTDYSFAPPLVSKGDDWNIGAFAGYLHQFGSFVVGAEGEYNLLDIRFEGFPIFVEDAYTARLRGGYAWDKFLFTGDIGASYVTTNIGLEDWALNFGAGIDYAVTENVFVGAHYNHIRAEGFDGTLIDATIDIATARLGFKF